MTHLTPLLIFCDYFCSVLPLKTRVSNFSKYYTYRSDCAVKAQVLILFWALYHQYPAWKHAGGKKLLTSTVSDVVSCFSNQTAALLSRRESWVYARTRPSWAALRTGRRARLLLLHESSQLDHQLFGSVRGNRSEFSCVLSKPKTAKNTKWKEEYWVPHWEVSTYQKENP